MCRVCCVAVWCMCMDVLLVCLRRVSGVMCCCVLCLSAALCCLCGPRQPPSTWGPHTPEADYLHVWAELEGFHGFVAAASRAAVSTFVFASSALVYVPGDGTRGSIHPVPASRTCLITAIVTHGGKISSPCGTHVPLEGGAEVGEGNSVTEALTVAATCCRKTSSSRCLRKRVSHTVRAHSRTPIGRVVLVCRV